MIELPERITSILNHLDDADRSAVQSILPAVYDELKTLAQRRLSSERKNHTLHPTELVHEAWIRLNNDSTPKWNNRAHFFRAAGRVMRFVLVDHARTRNREKRGGGQQKVQLDEALVAFEERAIDLISLDAALHRLESIAPRQMDIVELRFFAGFTVDEAADALGISPRTAYDDWRLARAWLFREIGGV
jgi:RNA polymerase sigma factor (TIGR02999 family)